MCRDEYPPYEPRPAVRLTDGNAFAVLGAVIKALRAAGASEDHIARFKAEATSGDYNHLLAAAMRYADVD